MRPIGHMFWRRHVRAELALRTRHVAAAATVGAGRRGPASWLPLAGDPLAFRWRVCQMRRASGWDPARGKLETLFFFFKLLTSAADKVSWREVGACGYCRSEWLVTANE